MFAVGYDDVPLLSVVSQACQVPEIVEDSLRQARELVLPEQIAFDRRELRTDDDASAIRGFRRFYFPPTRTTYLRLHGHSI